MYSYLLIHYHVKYQIETLGHVTWVKTDVFQKQLLSPG